VNKRNRSLRLTAVAVGAFGFAASLSALAGPWGCDHCVPIYYDCVNANPDNRDGCVADFWNCQTSNGCMISLPPDF